MGRRPRIDNKGIVYYKDINNIQMVNISSSSNHSSFPIMEINSTELFGFLSEDELKTRIKFPL